MPPIVTIARLTMREASRRKLLLALLVLTAIVVIASGWGFSKLWDVNQQGQPVSPATVRTIASQLLILVAFMFAAILGLSAAVVAAPSVYSDVESGLALSMLARPIRRSDLLIGKWLGLALILFMYTAGAIAAELVAVDIATGYLPPHPIILTLYIGGVGLVLLTMSIALSTRVSGITGAVIALAAYFMAWVGGIVAGIGNGLNNQALITAGTATKLLVPTDVLWRGAVWAMEPAPALAAARASGAFAESFPFAAAGPPPTSFLIWSFLWVGAVLAVAVWSFRRRTI